MRSPHIAVDPGHARRTRPIKGLLQVGREERKGPHKGPVEGGGATTGRTQRASGRQRIPEGVNELLYPVGGGRARVVAGLSANSKKWRAPGEEKGPLLGADGGLGNKSSLFLKRGKPCTPIVRYRRCRQLHRPETRSTQGKRQKKTPTWGRESA